ncbi:MAG TPA: hypothetical protein VMW24_08445, partial [Sedimentisphaerales bacterium]|nr:hypothetical protein [Sedimentisphaerales bacterium]
KVDNNGGQGWTNVTGIRMYSTIWGWDVGSASSTHREMQAWKDVCTLDVKSTPILGVPIAGGRPGTTDYASICDHGENVTLSAPQFAIVGDVYHSFVRWSLDGVDQPQGKSDLQAVMTGAHVAIAVYVATPVLKVLSAPFDGVPIAGTNNGITPYVSPCAKGGTVTLSAPDVVPFGTRNYYFLYWFVDGTPRPRFIANVDVVISKDTTAVAVYEQCMEGDMNCDCRINVLDLILLRNKLGETCPSSD